MVRELSILDYFLSIKVREYVDEIFLDQQLYLSNLLNTHDFANLRPIAKPMESKLVF